jgi:hypothetical protein
MVEKIKLTKPLTVDGKTIDEVDLSGLDALTGADIEFCIGQAEETKAGVMLMFELDTEFHAEVASKVTGIPRKQLREMGAKDYAKIIRPVRSFFAGSE